ncbi:glycoside hydrolase family 15 protein [Paenibacillus koleovorans]|uniref:glycoside hydrolase family 15 protein n=1 Tax=Paenibacillus koleovorans TaxID=121608 RepID=UPI000FDB6635|nr:glycoside hydrolase family 15 protein [Paenibacillus koleovorans]
MLQESYKVLDRLRLPGDVYIASPSHDYKYVWIRDCVYMSYPYLNKADVCYEKTYHRLLDLFLMYEWKINILCEHKPTWEWEYIHARYTTDLLEIHTQNWGHVQHDMIGAFLFGIGMGLKFGKPMLRSDRDRIIVQKLVRYLDNVQYWCDPDNGMWEENREVHASSVGACVAGLKAVEGIVDVPERMITLGLDSVFGLFPQESATKRADLSLLSLVYPYRLYTGLLGEMIVANVEKLLLRERGVIRYEGDSYYSTLESMHGRSLAPELYYGTEAEWTFGLPWLALCYMELGYPEKAFELVARTEAVMTEPGVLPELFYSGTATPNANTPLGWSSAMYILAKERMTGVSASSVGA